MDLLALRYFQAVARLEHISRAAEELHVAQPSLSRTIARLEADVGVRLFDRRGRRIRLNRYGGLFLRRVDRILGELEDARRELADAAELDLGSVSVSCETLLTLSGMLPRFALAHPEVEVLLHQADAEAMAAQLRERDVDFCVASQPLTGPGLRAARLLREEVLVACPAGHPLAGGPPVPVTDLAGEAFITTHPGHWMRALLDRLFAGAGLEPRITCESDEPAAHVQLIGDGLGVGLIPAMGREAAVRAGVGVIRLDDRDSHRTLDLVWRADAYVSAAAGHFRDFTTDHYRRLAESLAEAELPGVPWLAERTEA